MLQSFNTGGFAMTFENGLTINVLFGYGYQASNKFSREDKYFDGVVSAYSAEISISNDKTKQLYTFPLDGKYSQGYVNADGVAEWIKAVQKATSLKDIVEPENV